MTKRVRSFEGGSSETDIVANYAFLLLRDACVFSRRLKLALDIRHVGVSYRNGGSWKSLGRDLLRLQRVELVD